MHGHLVRVGAMGQLGRFGSAEPVRFARCTRVIVRTARGLEVGEVLAALSAPSDDLDVHVEPWQGTILRRMTLEDELLQARLVRHRAAAMEACSQRLAERNLGVTLLEAEHLFDGQTVLFYFLGDAQAELHEITCELAELYEAKVQFRPFAEALDQGCGPGCGTEHATGRGCGACAESGCPVASACTSSRAKMAN